MPGLYTVINRAPGTQITELIYNFDHQNHVDGRSATEMSGYGVSATQFGLTEDPFPSSVESLPASLAGEITRLRFVMAQIKGQLSGNTEVTWFEPLTSPGLPVIGARVDLNSISVAIPNNFSSVVNFSGGNEDFNTGVWDDMTNPTRFTAPVSGKYFAFAWVQFAAQASGRRQLQIGVNNIFNSQAVNSRLSANPTPNRLWVTGLLDLTANDYVEFAIFQNSGSSGTLSSAHGGLVIFGS